ncbi:MAG: metalloprotease TldD [Deltaproteobacteria bacterium]|nr:metalloprotease TldD [Deltaproteobacteria bacterium]
MDKSLSSRPEFSPAAFFDERFGVTARDLDRVLGRAMARQADYADLYFEYRTNDQVHLEEGLVKHASVSTANGVGARVLAEDKTGYAFTDDVTIKNLDSAVRTANVIASDRGSELPARVPAPAGPRHDLYPVAHSFADVPLERKIALLQELDGFARKADPRVKGVFASLLLENKVVLIASSQGWVLGDFQPLVRCNIRCIVEAGGKRQAGYFGWGGRMSLDDCTDTERCEAHAREAVRRALVNLEAAAAPAGPMDVVLGPGWPGILLHEAIGHGLEADFNRRKTSAFSGRIGERVATDLCTVVDDGTIPSRRGSLNVDDEGTPTQRTVLIENGILRGYMHDRLNAALLGMELTGNGRRESYAHVPMPRMTNTFMLAGEEDPEDIIRSVKDGLYAVSFGGGQVDITSGKFVFSANEAYRIEDGRITHPVRDATLIGNGPDVLTRVSRVGADLALDDGIGTCGKDGQGVPVGVGLPTIRVDQVVVGGTSVRGAGSFQG